jgi:hypothetical protein
VALPAHAQALSPSPFDEIIGERDRLAAVAAACRDHPMMEIAFALLTRSWAEADWRVRKDLLRTAAWMIDIQGKAPRLSKTDKKPPRRPTRHSRLMARSKRAVRKTSIAG